MTSSNIVIAIFLVITLSLSKAYIASPRIARSSTSSRNLIVSDSWRQSSVSTSNSFTRLFAAAPEAPKGRGPPPRKAPKDDVVQVLLTLLMNAHGHLSVIQNRTVLQSSILQITTSHYWHNDDSDIHFVSLFAFPLVLHVSYHDEQNLLSYFSNWLKLDQYGHLGKRKGHWVTTKRHVSRRNWAIETTSISHHLW